MGKVQKNQNGFSIVESLLILVIVAIVGFSGWYVYNANKKTNNTYNAATQSSTNTPTAANPYAGWKTYSDAHFSFKYPSDWKAEAPGLQGSVDSDVSLVGQSSDATYYTLRNANSKPNINFSLFNSGDAFSAECVKGSSTTCTVKAITPLKIKGVAAPKLVTYELTLPGSSSYLSDGYVVVDSTSVKVGDTALESESVNANGKQYQLTGCSVYVSGNGVAADSACAGINNYAAFKQSTEYKQLVAALNSLTLK